jgi:hypothetical protein
LVKKGAKIKGRPDAEGQGFAQQDHDSPGFFQKSQSPSADEIEKD